MSNDDAMAAGLPMPEPSAFTQIRNLFHRVKISSAAMQGTTAFLPTELAHQVMSILGIPEDQHEDYPVPVGPYPPTRVGVPLSLAESAVLSALSDLIVTQSNRLNTGLASIGNRVDGLVDVLNLHESALKNRFDEIDKRHERILEAISAQATTVEDLRQSIERTDLIHPDDLTKLKQAEYDRGVAAGRESIRPHAECTIDHEATSEHAFRSGKAIGQSEREAELLDQGWTPPGAITLHEGDTIHGELTSNGLRSAARAVEAGAEAARAAGYPGDLVRAVINAAIPHLEGAYTVTPEADVRVDAAYERGLKIGRLQFGDEPISTGPTDYEVWRDALTLAAQFVTGDGADWSEVEGIAEKAWEQLQDVPVLKNDDGTDTTPVEPCPECRAGKHGNCPETAINAADEMVPCPCPDPLHH